jgi:CBS domain-containing protein
MKVRDVMRSAPKYCAPGTNLAAVAEMLWRGGCGALPVVGPNDQVVGIITDRDVCLALGTRNRRPSEVTADQAMSHPPVTCKSSDEIHQALAIMHDHRLRRLPVLGDGGKLEGILSLSDLILQARHEDGSRPELAYEDVMRVLRSIYWVHSCCCQAC